MQLSYHTAQNIKVWKRFDDLSYHRSEPSVSKLCWSRVTWWPGCLTFACFLAHSLLPWCSRFHSVRLSLRPLESPSNIQMNIRQQHSFFAKSWVSYVTLKQDQGSTNLGVNMGVSLFNMSNFPLNFRYWSECFVSRNICSNLLSFQLRVYVTTKRIIKWCA